MDRYRGNGSERAFAEWARRRAAIADSIGLLAVSSITAGLLQPAEQTYDIPLPAEALLAADKSRQQLADASFALLDIGSPRQNAPVSLENTLLGYAASGPEARAA